MPVNSEYTTCTWFEYCWHLKQEQFHSWLCIAWLYSLLWWIENVCILHELTIESSKNQDFIFIHLCNTKSLSGGEFIDWETDNFPSFLVLGIVSLDRVNIFLRRIGDTAKYINHSILERATGMIMSAFIQIWNIKPDINIAVILLTSYLSLIIFLSWTSDDNKLLTHWASWMAMSRVLHFVSDQHLIVILNHNLMAFKHWIGKFIEITTTN